MTSIHGRYPDVDIVVHNTSVQGSDAMASMMEAISVLDADATVDVIVLTRGGGADKHLRVFNETPLCRVIHNASTHPLRRRPETSKTSKPPIVRCHIRR